MSHYGIGTEKNLTLATKYYEMSYKHEENAVYPAKTMITLIEIENTNYYELISNFIYGFNEYLELGHPVSIAGIVIAILYIFFLVSLNIQKE